MWSNVPRSYHRRDDLMPSPYRIILLSAFVGLLWLVAVILIPGGGSAVAQGPSGPNVEVINPPERPVNAVVLNGRTPIVLLRQMPTDSAARNMWAAGTTEDFVVPEGKQLVLEYVSMETFSHTLSGDEIYLGYFTNGGRRFLAGTVSAANSHFDFGPETGELIMIRYGPGATVPFTLFSNFQVLVNVGVSGYLEDLR
jgi:hypothetical protein